jgi:hypothetical protein
MLIAYSEKHIVPTSSTKFLGLIIDDALSWKNHKYYITTKLISAAAAGNLNAHTWDKE